MSNNDTWKIQDGQFRDQSDTIFRTPDNKGPIHGTPLTSPDGNGGQIHGTWNGSHFVPNK